MQPLLQPSLLRACELAAALGAGAAVVPEVLLLPLPAGVLTAWPSPLVPLVEAPTQAPTHSGTEALVAAAMLLMSLPLLLMVAAAVVVGHLHQAQAHDAAGVLGTAMAAASAAAVVVAATAAAAPAAAAAVVAAVVAAARASTMLLPCVLLLSAARPACSTSFPCASWPGAEDVLPAGAFVTLPASSDAVNAPSAAPAMRRLLPPGQGPWRLQQSY